MKKSFILIATLLMGNIFTTSPSFDGSPSKKQVLLEKVKSAAAKKAQEYFKRFPSRQALIEREQEGYDQKYKGIAQELTRELDKWKNANWFGNANEKAYLKAKQEVEEKEKIKLPLSFATREDLMSPVALDTVLPKANLTNVRFANPDAPHVQQLVEDGLPEGVAVVENMTQSSGLPTAIVANKHEGFIIYPRDSKFKRGIFAHELGHIKCGHSGSALVSLKFLIGKLDEKGFTEGKFILSELHHCIEFEADSYACTRGPVQCADLIEYLEPLIERDISITHPKPISRLFRCYTYSYLWDLWNKPSSKL